MNLLTNLTKVVLIIIALAFTVIIGQIVPKNQFAPYRLELDSLWQKEAGTRDYVVDLNNDSLPEIIFHRNINEASSALDFRQNGHL